jgi:hypothetical protein
MIVYDSLVFVPKFVYVAHEVLSCELSRNQTAFLPFSISMLIYKLQSGYTRRRLYRRTVSDLIMLFRGCIPAGLSLQRIAMLFQRFYLISSIFLSHEHVAYRSARRRTRRVGIYRGNECETRVADEMIALVFIFFQLGFSSCAHGLLA